MPVPFFSSRIERVSLRRSRPPPPIVEVTNEADNLIQSPQDRRRLEVERAPIPPPKADSNSDVPRLPLELVDLILSYLKNDTRLLLACGLVSRGWMNISRPYALRRITLVTEWGNEFKAFLDILWSYSGSSDMQNNTKLPSFVEYTKVVRLDLNRRISTMSRRHDEDESEERWARRGASLIAPLAHLTSVRFMQLFYNHLDPGAHTLPRSSSRLGSQEHNYSSSTIILGSISNTFTGLTGLSLLSTVFHSPYVLAGFVCSFPCLEDLTCSEVTFKYPSVLDWADFIAISLEDPMEGAAVKLADLRLSLKRLCLIVDTLGDFSVAWMTKLKELTVRRLIVDAKPSAHQLWRSVFQVLRVTGRVIEEVNFQRCNNLQEIALHLPKIGDLPSLHTLSIIIRQTVHYRASWLSHPTASSFRDKEEHLAVLLATLHPPNLRHIVIKLVDLGVVEVPEAREKQEDNVTLASVVPGTLNWGYLDEILSTAKLTPVPFPSHSITTSDIVSTIPTPTPRLPLLNKVTFAFQLIDRISVRTKETAEGLIRERMHLCAGAGVRVDVDARREVGWDWEGEGV